MRMDIVYITVDSNMMACSGFFFILGKVVEDLILEMFFFRLKIAVSRLERGETRKENLI